MPACLSEMEEREREKERERERGGGGELDEEACFFEEAFVIGARSLGLS
jgi:hypothetical protein